MPDEATITRKILLLWLQTVLHKTGAALVRQLVLVVNPPDAVTGIHSHFSPDRVWIKSAIYAPTIYTAPCIMDAAASKALCTGPYKSKVHRWF